MEANLLEDAALLKLAWVCLGALAFPLMIHKKTVTLVISKSFEKQTNGL